MANPQATSHEARISALAAMIEANTATGVHRGRPAAEKPDEYQNGGLPPQVHARLAVEAGTGLGWREYVGSEGRVIARYGFGGSAPIKDQPNAVWIHARARC